VAKNFAQIKVGRLLEIRSTAGYRTKEDVDGLLASYYAATKPLPPGSQYVTIVDHRYCPIMAPDAATYLSEAMRLTNDRTVRSATLTSEESASATLQYSRVVRDTGHASRRIFAQVNDAIVWLSQVLTPEERERLVRFLEEGGPERPLIAVRATRPSAPPPMRR
jgi:hypothetical protein